MDDLIVILSFQCHYQREHVELGWKNANLRDLTESCHHVVK
jgi:hypothetical protein